MVLPAPPQTLLHILGWTGSSLASIFGGFGVPASLSPSC